MRCLLFAAGLALTTPAFAAPPTDAQAREVAQMFGLDRLLTITSRKQVASANFGGLTEAQKSCLASGVEQGMEARVLASLAVAFRDGETVEAWKAFAATPGGARMMQTLRSVTASVAAGEAPAGSKELEASLTDAERRDLEAFASTPAASVMQADLSAGMRPTPEEAEALSARILNSCGVHRARQRT